MALIEFGMVSLLSFKLLFPQIKFHLWWNMTQKIVKLSSLKCMSSSWDLLLGINQLVLLGAN
jgi:hypothetical protein